MARHELARPDGRALYEYRLEENDLEELGTVLREELRRKGRIAVEDRNFWRAYVVYTALFSYFRYGGGPWTWDEIDRSIGLPEWVGCERSSGIRDAAAFFGHANAISDVGKKFIGYSIFQGGIPLKLLENREGGIFTLISQCVRQCRTFGTQGLKTFAAARMEADNILQSVDSRLMSTTVADAAIVMSKILERAEEARGLDDNAYAKFNEQFPGFRISEERFRAFVQRLAEEVRHEEHLEWYRIERALVVRDGACQLVARLLVPKQRVNLTFDEFRQTTGIAPDTLVRCSDLIMNRKQWGRIFVNPPSERTPGSVLLDIRKGRWCDRDALAAMIPVLRDPRSQRPFEIFPAVASNLDLDEPVLFRASATEGEWLFVGSGSVKTSADTALAMIPEDARLTDLRGQPIDVETVCESYLGSRVVRIGESVIVETGVSKYRLKLGSSESSELFVLRGDQLTTTVTGVPVFRGVPELYRHSQVCVSREKHFTWWRKGERVGEPDRREAGLYTIRVYDAAEEFVVKKLRVTILPEGASLCTERGRRGFVFLKGWGLKQAQALDRPDVTSTTDALGTTLACPIVAGMHKVETLRIACQTTRFEEFEIELDYPMRCARFLLEGKVLDEMAMVALSSVRGLVVKVLNDTDSPCELTLRTEKDSSFVLHVTIPVDPDTGCGNLMYDEFRSELYRMLRVGSGTVIMEVTGMAARIRVSSEIGTLIVDEEERCLRYGLDAEAGIPSPTVPTEAAVLCEPLYPEVLDEWNRHPRACLVRSGEPAEIPEIVFKTETPWIIRKAGDDRYAVRPVTAFGGRYPTRPDGSPIYGFLTARSVWTGELSDIDRTRALAAVAADFNDPESPQWAASERMLLQLGARGFALLPFWEIFRENVPLAFAYALTLDLRTSGGIAARGLVFELGRIKTWRWELISSEMLERALKRVVRLQNLRMRSDPTAERAEDYFLRFLRTDTAVNTPALIPKYLVALFKLDLPVAPALMEVARGTPYELLARAETENDERALNEQVLAVGRTVDVKEYGRAKEECFIFSRLLELNVSPDIVRRARARVQTFDLNRGARYCVMASPFLGALLWEAAGTEGAVQGHSLEFMKRIASKPNFFMLESALERNASWSQWCIAAAACLVDRSRQATNGSFR